MRGAPRAQSRGLDRKRVGGGVWDSAGLWVEGPAWTRLEAVLGQAGQVPQRASPELSRLGS